jgi:hypothetical protein
MCRCRLVALVLLASACGGSADPTAVDLEGEWDFLITNVQHFELTCTIDFLDATERDREFQFPSSLRA